MAEVRHLKNAPITEALIDINVELPKELGCESFLDHKDKIEPDFPTMKTKFAFETKIEVTKEAPIESTSKSNLHGYLFLSEDEKNIIQFRLDGFTRNQLNPYSSWDSFSADAKKWWDLYCISAQPRLVKRVAVRYINRFDIPASTADYSKFLTVPPLLPDGIPNIVTEFASRVVVHDVERRSSATIIQAIEPSIDSDRVTIVVDIDTWKDTDISLDSIWSDLDNLHALKNTIFFNTLTDTALEMFE